MLSTIPTVRPVDSGPGSDIPSRDDVCSPSVAADRAAELVTSPAIGTSNVPAERALLARVLGIDEHDRNADALRLVLDEGPELMEPPVAQSCSLSASGRDPLADAFEVFEGDTAQGALRLLHDGLGDAVVPVLLKSSLCSLDCSELPFCAPGLLSLEVSPSMGEASTIQFDVLSTEDDAIAVGGDVDDAEIDAEELLDLSQLDVVDLTGQVEVPLAFAMDEVCLAFPMVEELPLVLSHGKWDECSTLYCPDGDDALILSDAEDPRVVGLGSEVSKCRRSLLADLECVSDLCDGPDDHLGCESEAISDVVVNELLDADAAEGVTFFGLLCDLRTGVVARDERPSEEGRLLLVRQELDGSDELHLTHTNMNGRRFPPPPESRWLPSAIPLEGR